MQNPQAVADAQRDSAPGGDMRSFPTTTALRSISISNGSAVPVSAANTLRSLTVAAKACRDQVGLALAGVGLYSGQDALLRVLSRGEALCATEIAAELRVRPPTVTKMVDRLSAGGYVTRAARIDDRRRVRIELTDKGNEALSRVSEAWQRLDRVVAGAITHEELAQFSDLLRKVEGALTRSVDRLR